MLHCSDAPINEQGRHVTLITDQDKGNMGAIREVMPSVGHFFCSWHRRKNIIMHRGGASG
jgi:hypothetical protein